MIRYSLVCEHDHDFEAWFRNSATCAEQLEQGAVECPVCGSRTVRKGLMAPAIAKSGAVRSTKGKQAARTEGEGRAEIMRKAVSALRKHVENSFDYVGDRFAEEARRIHYGETDERGIYGEAGGEDVKDLCEEGILVVPLPEDPEKAN